MNPDEMTGEQKYQVTLIGWMLMLVDVGYTEHQALDKVSIWSAQAQMALEESGWPEVEAVQ